MDGHCQKCGWNLAPPSLCDAVEGFRECTNCEHRETVPECARRETLWAVEQQIHVLEVLTGKGKMEAPTNDNAKT